jgi:hypothetical protein
MPGIPLPPQPVLTRWGTWLDAAMYYADNFEGSGVICPWREKRLEMALIQISVPARENYRVIKGF